MGWKFCSFILAVLIFETKMTGSGPSRKARLRKVKSCWPGRESSLKKSWESRRPEKVGLDLGSVKQKGGKTVHAWAFAGDLEAEFQAGFEHVRNGMAAAVRQDAAVSRSRSRQASFRWSWREVKSIRRRPFSLIDCAMPWNAKRFRAKDDTTTFPVRSRRRGAFIPSLDATLEGAAGDDRRCRDLRLSTTCGSGRRRPDPLPQLIAAHRQALIDARQRT